MPLLSITTNHQSEAALTSKLLKLASEAVSAMLGKPERYVMVMLTHNPHMLFSGTNAPQAYLELKSIGLPEERTAELSQILSDLITHHLQIPADRIYIEFSDAQRHLWGWNAGTF